MLNFPESTKFERRIPKQKFYDNLSVTPAVKRIISEQIKQIIWSYKIAASTINLASGNTVTEIEVFTVYLNDKELDQKVLLQIDREIPYHILFILAYENERQAWVGYKEEAQSGTNEFKVSSYYHTEWINEEDLDLQIKGLDIDKVYENFITQISGNQIIKRESEDFGDAVERAEKQKQLQREIDRLEKLARKEVQPKKKFELVNQKRELEEELKKI